MVRRKDDPAIVLTVTRRGLVPAHPIDLEALAQLPFGTQLEVTKLTKPRSPALIGWWELMNIVGKALELPPRALSNRMLLEMGMVERHVRIGGYSDDPMSLRDFDETQLRRLTEAAKLLLADEIRGDPDELIRNHRKLRGAV
ncbi:hypothetical protein [Methylobacterium platani]|uniref:Uncharacterized protein n=2 Tax=Methylobacterium platani TaxID=427683 RepID=A0A179SFU5_9HYPH|nr:hypothetical protein [Methylobacterium platani]KMO21393.1 hypothetical protein SQ03_03310 [Methylobacterium platani JCM 14648]OAS26329.1 hypothetical protein A5481_06335 [Methylobacterium platani]